MFRHYTIMKRLAVVAHPQVRRGGGVGVENQIFATIVTATTTSTTTSPTPSRRLFSSNATRDNLMGFSPMAPGSVAPLPGDRGLTKIDSTSALRGGVWALTSAKRDKLLELRAELTPPNNKSLDDVATPSQLVDLHLAGGLGIIVQQVDQAWDCHHHDTEVQNDTTQDVSPPPVEWHAQLEEWLATTDTTSGPDASMSQEQFDAHLNEAKRRVEGFMSMKGSDTSASTSPPALSSLVDFCEFDPATEENNGATATTATTDATTEPNVVVALDEDTIDLGEDHVKAAMAECTQYMRLQLLLASINLLAKSWTELTTPTNADIDRAAVRGELMSSKPLQKSKLNQVLRSFASGSCEQRVEALWSLMASSDDNNDKDGLLLLLDEEEMNRVVHYSLIPVQEALKSIYATLLDRNDLPLSAGGGEDPISVVPQKLGWRARWQQKRHRKKLLRTFQGTMKRHFEDEIETPHRLRCIYAWADKQHQKNRIESVLVENLQENSGLLAGRQRHVELPPKISLAEFLEVQKEHFPHLDRAGQELMSSFREDLWVLQGKKRQNQELRRDCLLFLLAVSLVDTAIIFA